MLFQDDRFVVAFHWFFLCLLSGTKLEDPKMFIAVKTARKKKVFFPICFFGFFH